MKTQMIILTSLILCGCPLLDEEITSSESSSSDSEESVKLDVLDSISDGTTETSSEGQGISGYLCGNQELDFEEECDGFSGLERLTCTDFGYDEGQITCSENCSFNLSGCNYICGNGIISLGEDCDTSNFGSFDCIDYGFNFGELKCNEDCTIDSSGCSGECGGFFDLCPISASEICCEGYECVGMICVPME